jgi:hypothetical protein
MVEPWNRLQEQIRRFQNMSNFKTELQKCEKYLNMNLPDDELHVAPRHVPIGILWDHDPGIQVSISRVGTETRSINLI